MTECWFAPSALAPTKAPRYMNRAAARRNRAGNAFGAGRFGFSPSTGKRRHPPGTYTQILHLRFTELRIDRQRARESYDPADDMDTEEYELHEADREAGEAEMIVERALDHSGLDIEASARARAIMAADMATCIDQVPGDGEPVQVTKVGKA